MGIKVKVNERTKADVPEKPREEALWVLSPSEPKRPPKAPKMKPIIRSSEPMPERPREGTLPWNLPSSSPQRPPEAPISQAVPPRVDDNIQWDLPPSPVERPLDRPNIDPIPLPPGPRPVKPECIVPPKPMSPVINEAENELYEKILKALEKDHKRHNITEVSSTSWEPLDESGEFFYTTIKASEHNVVYPIVKDVFILNDEGNYEATFFSYEVFPNGDIRIKSSEPHDYRVYIESEE